MPTIVPVVEGEGEIGALPILLRRILWERFDRYDVTVATPVNAHGYGNLIARLGVLLTHAQRRPQCDAILILLDADTECPVQRAREMTRRTRRLGLNKPVAIVCAHREYESWFIASVESVCGVPEAPSRLICPDNFEDIQNPKQWLSGHMPGGLPYSPTSHQASFTNKVDLEQAHVRSRSFRRLCHAIEELSQVAATGKPAISPHLM